MKQKNESEINESINETIDKLNLITYTNINKCKSIRRAIRRGIVSSYGVKYPKRPFNNRKDRPLEDEKRSIYNGLKNKKKKMSSVELIETNE